MSVKFHRTEIVTRNARQLAIGGMLTLERSFSQAGIVITVAVPIHPLHLVNSLTNSRVSDALPLTKLSIVLQKVIVDHCIESPTAEQDQRLLKRLVGLSTQNVGLLIHAVGQQVCSTITRRHIEMTPVMIDHRRAALENMFFICTLFIFTMF